MSTTRLHPDARRWLSVDADSEYPPFGSDEYARETRGSMWVIVYLFAALLFGGGCLAGIVAASVVLR